MYIPKWIYTALFFLFLMTPLVVYAETHGSDSNGVTEGGASQPAKPEDLTVVPNIYMLRKRNVRRITPLQPRSPQSFGNPHGDENPRREAEGDRHYQPLNPFVIRW